MGIIGYNWDIASGNQGLLETTTIYFDDFPSELNLHFVWEFPYIYIYHCHV